MTRLVWNGVSERIYEAGVDRGVLYVDGEGFPWNGLISVTESPSGGDPTPFYIDGFKYLNLASLVEFEATLEAFTYPEAFEACDGTLEFNNGLFITQQYRKSFGLAYRSLIGNDVDGVSHGYKIHVVYNASAQPAEQANTTLGENVDPSNFSWKITTKPSLVKNFLPSAHFIIDSRSTPPDVLTLIEDILYGTESETPRLPDVRELIYRFSYHDPELYDAGEVGEPYYRTFDSGEVGTEQTNTIDSGEVT